MKVPKFNFTGTSMFNIAGALVIVYLVVLLGQTITNNYGLGQQISNMKGQIDLLQAQKAAMSYEVQYYKTNSALDREARAQLDLQLPNEHVIIIPNDSPSPSPGQFSSPIKPTKQGSNFQQWLGFLSGRT